MLPAKISNIVRRPKHHRRVRSALALGFGVLALGLSRRALAQGVTEFPLPGVAEPQVIVSGPDGNLWFTELLGRIGRMTPAGSVTEFTIPTSGSGPQGISAGPDGALWFAEGFGNRIGRVTTAGAFTEFPLPTAGSSPQGIAVGPDAALWFTESRGNRIGRITTAGAITEFTIPTASTAPNFIAAGPDGNLWFTERGKNKIGRVTTAGVFAEFSIPTANAFPEGIAAGPDGNLWFAENSGGHIGRITPAGTITEFPLPAPTRVFQLTAGSDGNLWFPEFDNNKIGRITTAGVVTEFLILTAAAGPYGIASVPSPSGDLWFTEFRTDQIGRFVIGGQPPPQIDAEFPVPGAALVEELAAGPDGNLWFTEVGKIGRFTPAAAVTEFTIPTPGSNPQGICAGGDGALWFTESSGNKIGRIDTAGGITEHPLPSASSAPQGIAPGPDGALWFAETSGNRIGRITTAGAISELPVPTAGSGPQRIVAGPDGALWFTEHNKNIVGRATTAGAFQEFPIPTPGTFPEDVAAGADGNLWFSENSGHKIGRVTPAGAVTEFPLPSSTRVFHLAAGPDGNLWFTEFDANKIGRITAAGGITEFLIPTTDSGPYGIAAREDGNLWFSEFRATQIGRVGVGTPTLAVSSVAPTSGPASGGTSVTAAGSGFAADATLQLGLSPARNTQITGSTQASGLAPPLAPGLLHNVVVTNPASGAFGWIPNGWLADFLDVPGSHPFHGFVERVLRDGVASGCGGGNYCPTAAATRAQMAVFLLRSKNGAAYTPPPATGTVFLDVPAGSFAAAWIEALAAAQVTGGCGGGNYCPGSPVTRDQMAVFLLRTLEGPAYTPPACATPVFADVPCSSGFARWIDELAARGITAGCGGGDYCPASPVTRGQMAVFLVTTFGLP